MLQIKVFLPAEGGPELGLVRAIMKSAADIDRGNSSVRFLDSDGSLNLDSVGLQCCTFSNCCLSLSSSHLLYSLIPAVPISAST